MANNNAQPQQNRTPFGVIEPLFYTELTNEYPFLPQWTLERMPRSVNTRRLNLDKNKMSGKWSYARYNSGGKFFCAACIRRGVDKDEAAWSSGYITFLFRGYYGPDTDEFGDTWIAGWVQMKVFAQACMVCEQYNTCELDNERAKLLVKWLHRWIANTFHGYHIPNPPYRGKGNNKPHQMNRCEARGHGWCKYCNG